jgi:hypothetical protein
MSITASWNVFYLSHFCNTVESRGVFTAVDELYDRKRLHRDATVFVLVSPAES